MLEHGTASTRGHRHRHEGRLQLPDGAVRAARPGRPRHVASPSSTRCTTSSATRTTPPVPTLRRMVAAGQPRPQDRPRLLHLLTSGVVTAADDRWSPSDADRAAADARGSSPTPAPATPTTSSASAPTSSPARCSPPTAAGCSRCRVAAGAGGRAGGRPTRAASSRSTGCASPARCAGRCGATRSASTPRSATSMRRCADPTPAAAGGSPRRSSTPTRGCTSWLGPQRRGCTTATASWPAASTASHRRPLRRRVDVPPATRRLEGALVALVERLRGDGRAAARRAVDHDAPRLARCRRRRRREYLARLAEAVGTAGSSGRTGRQVAPEATDR